MGGHVSVSLPRLEKSQSAAKRFQAIALLREVKLVKAAIKAEFGFSVTDRYASELVKFVETMIAEGNAAVTRR